jgi:hypothetical protein
MALPSARAGTHDMRQGSAVLQLRAPRPQASYEVVTVEFKPSTRHRAGKDTSESMTCKAQFM